MVRPCYGQRVSGDTAFISTTTQGLLAAVVDVLGHGEEAHVLAMGMQDYLLANVSDSVVDMLSRLHEAYRGSRGAAVGLCLIDNDDARLRFAGIGNTVIRRFGRSESRLVSRDGVVGGTMRKPAEAVLELSDGDVILLYQTAFAPISRPPNFRGCEPTRRPPWRLVSCIASASGTTTRPAWS